MARSSALTDEKKWRAQSDAETLARAQEIMGDRSRLSAAKAIAKTEAAKMAKVASTSPGKRK